MNSHDQLTMGHNALNSERKHGERPEGRTQRRLALLREAGVGVTGSLGALARSAFWRHSLNSSALLAPII